MIQTKALVRSFGFKDRHHHWLSNSLASTLETLRQDYEKAAFEDNAENAYYVATPQQSFFLWIPENIKEKDEGDYLVDYFKDKMKPCGYYNYTSDERRERLPKFGLRIIRRHYLKPLFRIQTNAESSKSHYGNVFFEVSNDGENEPYFIKITANYYGGETVLPFESLIKYLLT